MFRTAELGRKVGKKEYKERALILRQQLLEMQQKLNSRDKNPLIIVFAGVDGAGKGETVNLLNEWMDPRWITTRAYDTPTQEERERPEYWRFWRDLPANGKIGLYLSSWYSRPVLDRVKGNISLSEYDEQLQQIISFENSLVDDGAIILKFWMHLSKGAQKVRFTTLEKDPKQSWRVTKQDWKHWKKYDKFLSAAERVIMRTSTGGSPWHIIEGGDANYRSLTVGEMILESVDKKLLHLEQRDAARLNNPNFSERESDSSTTITTNANQSSTTLLSSLDMSNMLSKKDYKQELIKQQGILNKLHRKALAKGISTLLLFEGADAAGKGGAIRRITAALDARNVQVIPIAAPTDEEKAHHYLWRFWRHLSRAGRFTIFDRSWYGRVLVERVEKFASEREWRRAYAEINDFENQLAEHNIVLVKFWVHIDKDEQLTRFKAREVTPHKKWKLTDEDWRNREKWDEYEQAVNDMIEHTSTHNSPWVLVEGNSKLYSRIKVIKTVCEHLSRALDNR
ncbi:MAG: polyphosphate:AMP phosphotransferase [Thiotrichales bacterium]|jgi:polyphosphate:AMP phosphotransferase|nr:polyphosphate:AMP phosphotransferase [Thiotrichales bacterium]MBT3613330.1 polyphosphate:AMP phosphotransferase [Thiotrichales bacterium]MBT3753385.1 polyphosphate:AMP phosphotransferase [Thiotrichales bacterium]MBT3837504.1 polyphosphate:AMP phosphotransferase [Thiotrichales bacterium]MBT4152368.1 polyphosphate:AMP phosphotransferase [Thiotrichales bacterium]